MDKKKAGIFRKRLLAKQEELLRQVSKSEQDGRQADGEATQDIADKAANSYTKEFLFHQSDDNRRMLQLITEALERLKNGSYGLCVACHEEVQRKRWRPFPGLVTASSARKSRSRAFSDPGLSGGKRGSSSTLRLSANPRFLPSFES